ncbi:hypothetical protein AVEN_125946-1 [Araneus ventricosus]|uniref:Uncharacterized protein n=1 Tax=Araneus ventricosus TaxID=182803 RepID=A0A4Y2R3E3_ARAVE|nr:hypothetical protein AVEN_125946-1 [Araneus ventricosus]
MSDDEEISYVKRQKIIHFGSLEEQERQKLEQEKLKEEDSDSKESSEGEENEPEKEATASGSINVSEVLIKSIPMQRKAKARDGEGVYLADGLGLILLRVEMDRVGSSIEAVYCMRFIYRESELLNK